jgi:PAS domain S-box-containing protein
MAAASPNLRPPAWAATLGLAAALQLTALTLGRPDKLGVLLGVSSLLALVATAGAWAHARVQLRRVADSASRAAASQRAIIDGAAEAIIVIDDQAVIQTFNRAAERLFGYSADEMLGQSLEQLMTDGARREHAVYLAENGVTAMVQAARLRTVHNGVRKRGDVFPFELHMTEWFDGERRMFTGVVRDITEHERATRAMRQREGYFAVVFDNVTNPLFIFALSGAGEFVLESMNQSAEQLLGLSRFAGAGLKPEDLTRADARDLKRAMFDCLSGQQVMTQNLRLEGQAGERPVRLALSPMRDGSGEIRGVLASARVRSGDLAPAAGQDRRAPVGA